MKNKHVVDLIAVILLVIGGLNWGLIGLFSWDVIASVFGEMTNLTRVIYALIGLSAVYRIALWAKARA